MEGIVQKQRPNSEMLSSQLQIDQNENNSAIEVN